MMKIALFTVPVEVNYSKFVPTVRPDTDVFVSSIRSDGQLPVMPKIAIVSLIKWMEANGFTKDQYDFYDLDMLLSSDEEIVSYLKEYRPTVVGLSAVVSTCYAQVKRISSLVRAVCPDCWIVLGGSLAASSNLVLHKTSVDVCIVGDGEIAWVNFLRYVEKNGRLMDYSQLSTIVGLAFLNASRNLIFTGYGHSIPGGSNPLPDYEILKLGLRDRKLEINNYFRRGLGSTAFQTDPRSYSTKQRPMLAQLWTTKGCVARCTFCQRSTKGYRTFSIDALDEHLKILADEFDVGFIHILDENFGSDNSYARELAKAMQRNNMLWMASGVRVTSVEYEDIKFFKEHGCVSLKFGVESGSQKILDVMEKKFTVDRVFQTLKYCSELKIYSPLAVMVGMPGETNETAAETGRYLGRLSYMCGVDPDYAGFSVFYALPLTGTPLYVYGQQIGVIGKTPDEEESYLMSVSGTGANKTNYVNLSGAKIKDVIWWDWLIKLEARREFDSMVLERGSPEIDFIQKVIVEDKKREIIGNALSLRQILKAVSASSYSGLQVKIFFFGDSLMDRKIVSSKFIARLPRGFVYPILRNLIFAQHTLQGFILSVLGRQFNLWKKWPSVELLNQHKGDSSGVDINLSLRRIIKVKQSCNSNKPDVQDVMSVGL